MRRILVLCSLLLALTPVAAYAQAPCQFPTGMAGTYVDQSLPMRVQVYPCGGVSVLWDNQFGRHEAHYITASLLVGGGMAMRGYQYDPVVGWLDGTDILGVKPGTPGFIQVVTVSPYGETLGFYELRKV